MRRPPMFLKEVGVFVRPDREECLKLLHRKVGDEGIGGQLSCESDLASILGVRVSDLNRKLSKVSTE